MTHEDAGHYAAKRRGARLNETIAAELRKAVRDNTILCAEAHGIAGKLNVSPAEVGIAIDLLEVRITQCQLGLFGHNRKKNIAPLPDKIDSAIESAINSSLVEDRLPCFAAWEIARKLKMARPAVAAICEKIKIKISPCQLGAF